MRVLLVDDEEELVTALAERLEIRGIEADWALSGEQAFEKARAKQYDIAVLDVKMPKIGGLELMDRLRSMQPAMRFIFLTGHGSAEDFEAGKARGAFSYLMKPVKIEALIDNLNRCMHQG